MYILVDGDEVKYVGRTKNKNARFAAHKRDQNKCTLEPVVLADDLTYHSARAYEQAAFFYYKTIKMGDRQHNQINGIAPKLWPIFKEAAVALVRSGFIIII